MIAKLLPRHQRVSKRYHKENGSDFVRSIVEFESELAIKTRTKEIDAPTLEVARRRFRADPAQQRLLLAASAHECHFHDARRLLSQYGVTDGLRTLDALQLAVALDLRQCGPVGVLAAADQRLCRVSALAGCPAVSPNAAGTLLV